MIFSGIPDLTQPENGLRVLVLRRGEPLGEGRLQDVKRNGTRFSGEALPVAENESWNPIWRGVYVERIHFDPARGGMVAHVRENEATS